MKIYLAGKIAKNDWRHELMPSLRWFVGNTSHFAHDAPPPELHRELGGDHIYVGPYFMACDHGCAHTANSHGALEGTCKGEYVSRVDVKRACFRAINDCDIFFAWLDDPTAYGTMVEIGIAEALGKLIYIGVPKELDEDDLWFAKAGHPLVVADTPIEAVRKVLGPEPAPRGRSSKPSYIESAFYDEWFNANPDLKLSPQHPILTFFVDFAHTPSRIAIELDGLKGHGTPAEIEKDRKRQRAIEDEGWSVVRFGGREVNLEPRKCVAIAEKRIREKLDDMRANRTRLR